MKSPPPLIALIGPTASGKSDLAAAIAARFPVEIISLDSAQVYLGMDIGTAKPDAQTRRAIPHHLIDILAPTESYSAGRFREDALTVSEAIIARGHIPLLVGGTMLYYQTLVAGLARLPSAHADIRAEIDRAAAQHGWPALHAELARVDPQTAARLSPTDGQRIQRALEVYRATGQPLSLWLARQTTTPFPYRRLTLALDVDDRMLLAARIAERFQRMLAQGLVSEVEALRERYPLTAAHPSMRCVGYRQVWQMLEGEFPRSALAERGIAATRQLAKRQLTWLRSFREKGLIDHLFAFSEASLEAKITAVIARFLDAVAS
ncbi:MAG: tRNA (adenosine(37)-N6)-dimethylallyltransferase MiaA [Rhodocyclaceae bacterium]|nr:tRNA (adenosine(37)-N6)-dimethylallyltransferase MiaA [Rhodocyclaceae bacterium]